MSNQFRDLGTVRTQQAPPDPAILKAIGLSHGLGSAIADLVDNSIDARASRVLIRFVLEGGLVGQLYVADNGEGMDAQLVDHAMRLGVSPQRDEGALGHFGMGLKAASFSQASLLTVLSRCDGGDAVGRRIPREPGVKGFVVEELDGKQVAQVIETSWADLPTSSGTIVLWDQIRTFPKSLDRTVTDEFVNSKVAELRNHLGLTFHRLIESRTVRIDIDVQDAETGAVGLPFEVEPIDPFAYGRSGAVNYPKTLEAEIGSARVPVTCHIWPPRSDSHSYKLTGRPVDQTQGFYLYRHDRLLSAGGWTGVTTETKQLRLARVAIDIEGFEDEFVMAVDKAGVQMTADLVRGLESAVANDGTTFRDYLGEAEQVFRVSNQRKRKRTPMLPPGQGIAPLIKRAIRGEVECLEQEEPLRIRWQVLPHQDFIEVDRRNRTLWLNSRYRNAILKGQPGSVNDAPVLKALLYLLYEDIFRGVAFGPKDKDNVNLWGEILKAAAFEEHNGFPE